MRRVLGNLHVHSLICSHLTSLVYKFAPDCWSHLLTFLAHLLALELIGEFHFFVLFTRQLELQSYVVLNHLLTY